MISKELLQIILGETFIAINVVGNKCKFKTETDMVCGIWRDTNIYELAHICKEWAYTKDYGVSSTVFSNTDKVAVVYAVDKKSIYKYFDAPTEPEAIFKACEWIRKRL